MLVIIGLLVGGVLQGRELIEAAKRQKVISEITQYQTALNTYRLQFDALPGDHDEAADYWPSLTTNGDGNGQIGGAWNNLEDLTSWVHLSLSEILSGEYTGAFHQPLNQRKPGVNVPVAPYDNGGYLIRYNTTTFVNNLIIGGYGIVDGSNRQSVLGGILLSKTAKSIDGKIDDGLPESGKVKADDEIGRTSVYFTDCVSSSKYNLTLDTEECNLIVDFD